MWSKTPVIGSRNAGLYAYALDSISFGQIHEYSRTLYDVNSHAYTYDIRIDALSSG